MKLSCGVDQLDFRSDSIGAFIYISFVEQLVLEKNEHGPHLLPLAVDDVIGFAVEKWNLGLHRIVKFRLEECHFTFDGFPYLRAYFQRIPCFCRMAVKLTKKRGKNPGFSPLFPGYWNLRGTDSRHPCQISPAVFALSLRIPEIQICHIFEDRFPSQVFVLAF